MFARLALLTLAILAAGTASASRQTHEVLLCDSKIGLTCYGDDGNVAAERVNIRELYAEGWRLIEVVQLQENLRYIFERPIATEQ
jgi:hypothetical protein